MRLPSTDTALAHRTADRAASRAECAQPRPAPHRHGAEPDRRIQRREFKDYQPLFILINSLDFIDEATRREFICIHGPVWQRYNDTTRRTRERRITTLFLSDENNLFHELLFVGCDALKGREHRCRVMWNHPDWPLDEALARHVCITLGGRSVLRAEALWPAHHRPVSDPSTGRLRDSESQHRYPEIERHAGTA